MIYLIDSIGQETGMHLYDETFQRTIEANGLPVTILSNYDSQGRSALFPNFYHGGKLVMMICFAWALFKVLCFRLTHHAPDDVYIYQSFGLRKIDQLMIRMLLGWPKLYVIVHDIFEITGSAQGDPAQQQKLAFYNRHIPAVICHSQDTERELKQLGYQGRTCYFPHFSYSFNKEVDMQKVQADVRRAIDPKKVNFLFFGQVRETKGILILQEAIDIIAEHHPDFGQHANIIIAGMDKGRLIAERPQPSFVQTMLRYMDDSELNYLFQQHPIVLLPYTEIYQSGVLEVVIYFQCHALMSDVAFFRGIADRYPSFGTIVSPNTPQALADAMLQAVTSPRQSQFAPEDIQRYHSDHDCQELCKFISNNVR